jgi:hypothetical protein
VAALPNEPAVGFELGGADVQRFECHGSRRPVIRANTVVAEDGDARKGVPS